MILVGTFSALPMNFSSSYYIADVIYICSFASLQSAPEMGSKSSTLLTNDRFSPLLSPCSIQYCLGGSSDDVAEGDIEDDACGDGGGEDGGGRAGVRKVPASSEAFVSTSTSLSGTPRIGGCVW